MSGRRLDLFAFRGDDSDGDDDLPAPKTAAELNAQKSNTFKYGNTKKTKVDLEREAEEKKRKEDEEATQRALEEFAQSFDGPKRGPTGNRGWGTRGGFVRAGERAPIPPPSARAFAMDDQPSRSGRPPSPPPAPKPRGKRAMDAFLQEIKHNQEVRDARLGKVAERQGVSVSALMAKEGPGRGRPETETTNLFIVNLPANASEHSLGNLFAKCGPVGTVKIMWPRGGEDFGPGRRPNLTGFVCYMKRADAEKALREYDGYEWLDNVIRVSWSKPAPIPRVAAYEWTGVRRDSPPASSKRKRSRSISPRRLSPERDAGAAQAYWLAQVSPDDLSFIKAVVEKVRTHGTGFSDMLRTREADNPRFAFLSKNDLPESYAFQHFLDPNYTFPAPPHTFADEGYASVYSSDSAEGSEAGRARAELGRLARRRLETMLRGMSGKRVEIARAMEFAMKRAEAAEEVADIVAQSLAIDDTPVPRKVARLHLVSDILHNSASPMPNVWRYRQAFEKRLPEMFAHFADVYSRLLEHTGPIAADVFRQQVAAVLIIWERWIVFTADVTDALGALLHGAITLEEFRNPVKEVVEVVEAPKVVKSVGFKSSFKRVDAAAEAPPPPPPLPIPDGEDVDGEPMEDLDGEPVDLDGEPLDEDLDGEPVDLDGEPNEEDLDGEDMDGEPMEMDEDVDGEPM